MFDTIRTRYDGQKTANDVISDDNVIPETWNDLYIDVDDHIVVGVEVKDSVIHKVLGFSICTS